MHEQATIKDLVSTVVRVAEEHGAKRVVRIKVRLGALSHFTPEHFEEHWIGAAAGTVTEGCTIESELSTDLTDPNAQGVVLEDVEIAVG